MTRWQLDTVTNYILYEAEKDIEKCQSWAPNRYFITHYRCSLLVLESMNNYVTSNNFAFYI